MASSRRLLGATIGLCGPAGQIGPVARLPLVLPKLPTQAKDLTTVTLVQSSLTFNFVPLYIAQDADLASSGPGRARRGRSRWPITI